MKKYSETRKCHFAYSMLCKLLTLLLVLENYVPQLTYVKVRKAVVLR